MVRYPHNATISINANSKDADGFVSSIPTDTSIKGRFDPTVKSGLDYSGKFFCPVLSYQPFEIEGQKLIYNNIEFEIYKFHNYQNHCELWLK